MLTPAPAPAIQDTTEVTFPSQSTPWKSRNETSACCVAPPEWVAECSSGMPGREHRACEPPAIGSPGAISTPAPRLPITNSHGSPLPKPPSSHPARVTMPGVRRLLRQVCEPLADGVQVPLVPALQAPHVRSSVPPPAIAAPSRPLPAQPTQDAPQ